MTRAATAERPWLGHWRAHHTQAVALLLCAVIVTTAVVPTAARPAIAIQVVALVVAVAVFGIPHGALDPLVGRRWLAPRLGPRWWAPFHAAYLLLAGVVVLGWIRAPAVTLVAFLSASVVHFGLGDVVRQRSPRGLAWAEVLVRGAAPITVPALAHPAAVHQAFTWVAPGASAATLSAIVAVMTGCARWIVLPACILFALTHVIAARRPTRLTTPDVDATRPSAATRFIAMRVTNAHVTDAIECLAVPAVAMILPPLVAFLVYFCLLHSARHALELAASLDPVHARRAWARFVGAALPATLATLAVGALAWTMLARRGGAIPTAAAVRVLFAGLAALTAPHMLLITLAGEDTAEPARDLARR